MVVIADKLSIWLDKNVKVSKNVRDRLWKMEEEEKKERLMEEMKRLDQEKRDQEEEKKQKMAEELANKKEADLLTRDEIQPPLGTVPEAKESQAHQERGLYEPETGDDKIQETVRAPTGEAQEGGQQALEQRTFHPSPIKPSAESADGAQDTGEKSEYETELDGTRQILEASQEGKLHKGVTQESDSDGTDHEEATLEDADKQVPSEDDRRDENLLDGDKTVSFKDMSKPQSLMEKDIPADSPIIKVLDFDRTFYVEGTQNIDRMQNADGSQNGEETVDASYPSPEITELLLDTIGASYRTPSEGIHQAEYSAPPSSDSEFSDRDELKAEPSKDTGILVDELLDGGKDAEDAGMFDRSDHLIEIQGVESKSVDGDMNIQDNQGNSVDDKTNMVLNELAEMMAGIPEVHSPIQGAIKDIVEKELEDRLGDRDAETINSVAGKVGTWIDQVVERVWEEYGGRSSITAEILPQVSQQPPFRPMPVAQASFSPATALKVPTPTAVLPEGLAKSLGTVESRYPLPPVSQKPKGPVFELRKVAPKNIFNVAGITNSEAKRKIRKVRGRSISRPISQDSFDLKEWAEWAGLVSDVGQNWAKWIQSVAQAVVRPQNCYDQWLSTDANEWKHMNEELQREGDVWMQKAVRKQSKHFEKTPKPVST